MTRARALVVYGKDGKRLRDMRLPGLGTAIGFPDSPKENETFFAYTDYLTPLALYRYDVAKDEVTPFRKPTVSFDPAPYVTEQVFYESKDGTRVPMFITRRKDAKLDGTNPTLLYGYGGFDVSLTPTYSAAVAAWLEQGGVYAVANLRGGGEYGADWHDAGTRTKKQNVFDDFIAAAEWLIAKRYTSPPKLAIHGRSNGGLLVGAVMAQRPELFGAALPGVGVMDMLRYHTASANAYAWSSDYGTVEDAEQFRALLAYSPVHNLKPGRCYPPTLVTTADHDDRVVPWHSFKFAAALQHAQACASPVLIRIETRAGHGAGKPTWMLVEDWANQWAFLVKALGHARRQLTGSGGTPGTVTFSTVRRSQGSRSPLNASRWPSPSGISAGSPGMAFCSLEPAAKVDELAALAAERAPGIAAPLAARAAARAGHLARHRAQ